MLFETRPAPWTETYPNPESYWFGGLREIYDDLPFPVLEWTQKGSDKNFDLDVLIQQNYFYAHVTQVSSTQVLKKRTGKPP